MVARASRSSCAADWHECTHSRCCASNSFGCHKRPTRDFSLCRKLHGKCVDSDDWLCPGWDRSLRVGTADIEASIRPLLGGSRPASAMNVLFLMVDDLRPQLGSYGHNSMHSPSLDRLASEAVVFERAYANYPYCSPSRNSFLSGRLPDVTQVWNFQDDFRHTSGGDTWISLPQHFKRHGWWAAGVGKVFHQNKPEANDYPLSWHAPYPTDVGEGCDCPTNPEEADMACELAADANCFDVQYADHACSLLRVHAQVGGAALPFFVALGLHKPHLPWAAPSPFYDLYPPADAIATALHADVPEGSPPLAVHANTWKHFPHTFYPGRPVARTTAQLARRAYYACVSFVDSLVGRVLSTLDEVGRRNDTIVLLSADHGFQLGEHNQWGKQTLWELALRVPFMIRDPRAAPATKRTAVYVTLIDMYRTLAELAGAPAPEPGVAGRSVAGAVLGDGAAAGAAVAFAQVARCVPESVCDTAEGDPSLCANLRPEVPPLFQIDDACTSVARERIDWMGYTVRVPGWRYTAWVRFGPQLVANWSVINSTELYAHAEDEADDFDASETRNVARDEANAELVRELHSVLRSHFGPPPPPSPPDHPPRPPPPVATIRLAQPAATDAAVTEPHATVAVDVVRTHAADASPRNAGLAAAVMALCICLAALCRGRGGATTAPGGRATRCVELSASSSTQEHEGLRRENTEEKEEAAARDVGPPSAVSASATRRKRRSEKKALLPTDAIGSEELAPVPCPATELPAEFSDVLGTPEHDLD